MTKNKTMLTFEQWMEEVNEACYVKTDCSVYDLCGVCFRDWSFEDWYRKGVTPRTAINRFIRWLDK